MYVNLRKEITRLKWIHFQKQKNFLTFGAIFGYKSFRNWRGGFQVPRWFLMSLNFFDPNMCGRHLSWHVKKFFLRKKMWKWTKNIGSLCQRIAFNKGNSPYIISKMIYRVYLRNNGQYCECVKSTCTLCMLWWVTEEGTVHTQNVAYRHFLMTVPQNRGTWVY